MVRHITALKVSAEALWDSEARLRLIVENVSDYAIFAMDTHGRIMDWRGGAETIFGYAAAEIVGRDVEVLFTREDREAGVPKRERSIAAADGRAPDVRWYLCKDGHRVFIDGMVAALYAADGSLIGYLKIGHDVTDTKRSEERHRLLLAELQHRVRNILATIQSVVRRTLEMSDTAEEYASHLGGRIAALGRTQAMLTNSAGHRVNLEEIVREELLSVIAPDTQYWCEGPDVALPPKAAEVMTMAIHELATNAAKYGAFSQEAGQLEVSWWIEDRQGQDWIVFKWEETG